jgi:Protein of unknown function (DUF2800)
MKQQTTNGGGSHATLAPSSAERWIACPGSVQAQIDVFDPSLDDSNPDSRLGTAAHALLEACLLLDREPKTFIGTNLMGDDKYPPVDEDMCDWVQVALDYIEEYVDTHGPENLLVSPESRVIIGPQINITGDDDKDAELCNGTSDVIIAHSDMSLCIAIDYKNGVNKVFAKDNPQTMLYMAGVRHALGKFKKYRSVVIQPRAGKRSPVDEWEFTDSMLRKFLQEKVRPSARAALLPNAPRNAGDHCRYCKASPRCRTRRDKVMAIAGVEFSAIEEADPELLSQDEFLEVLNNAKFIEDYIHSVRGHALKMVERDPRALPGWVLGWTKRMREWDNEANVVEFCRKLKLPPDDYSPRVLLSPAQLTKLLKKRRPAARRKKGEPAPTNPLEAFVKYSIPTAKLVHAEETASEDFNSLE